MGVGPSFPAGAPHPRRDERPLTAAALPPDEAERLEALEALELLDTPPDERFDRVTRLASRLFEVPIALVTLVDEDRQWFKSNVGLAAGQTARDVSFCAHAILDTEVLVVPDTWLDPRFAENPLVTEDPHIRFYAGYPLRTPSGQPVGTLCLIDHEPRQLSGDEQASLMDLGRMIEHEFTTAELANQDGLTGLQNRRGFEIAASPMLAAAGRLGVPVTAIFIDLDGFKRINDEFGHAEGDRALCETAAILIDVFRTSDVVARVGGDEFCILVSGTNDLDVQEPLARLASAVEARNQLPGAAFEIRYSAGAVSFDGETTTTHLLAEADRRMYRNKRRTGAATTQRELAQVLLELAGSLTDPVPTAERLDRLCRQAVDLLGCDRSSIFLWDGDCFTAAHNFGNPPDVAEQFGRHRVSLRDPLIAAAFGANDCIAVNDAAGSDLVNSETVRTARIRSIVVAPMIDQTAPLGFMTAEYNERTGIFSDLDTTLLHGISRLVAGVLKSLDLPA